MTRAIRSRAVLVAVVLMVVLSAAAAGVGLAGHTDSPDDSDNEDAYVTDDGDVVLVSNEQASPDSGEGQYGVDVGSNLAYFLVTNPLEGSSDVQGNLSVEGEPTALQLSGAASLPRPENLESFSLNVSSQSDAENARSDWLLSADWRDDTGMAQLIDTVSTDGNVTMSGSGLAASGQFRAETTVPMEQSVSMDVSIRETDGGYVLRMAQQQQISEWAADQWANRSVARQTIERQFARMATAVGGSADVTIHDYALEEAGNSRYALTLDFEVTYTGVEEGLTQILRMQLARNDDVSDSQADALAQGISELQINRLAFSYRVQNGVVEASFDADLDNYGSLMLAYLDVAQSVGDEGSDEQFERARDQLEAQQAADVEQRYRWSGSLTTSDSGTASLDFELRHRTTNWAAYVDELQSRDVPLFDSSLNVNGSVTDERLTLSGSMETTGEDLYRNLFRTQTQGLAIDESSNEMLEALRRSGPQRVKAEMSLDENRSRIEAAAAFSNLSAIRDAVVSESDAPEVASIVARTENETGGTYLRVSGAVGEEASKEDVRSLEYVDEDTTIHMPGEWDRDFPEMDTERAEEFLGMTGETGGDSSSGAFGPGFTAVAALLAILGAALVAARRID